MKLFFRLSLFVMVVSVLIAVASYPIQSRYAARAQLVQRVSKDAADNLFESEGTPIGSPQMLIIEDPKAFTGGKTKEGAAMVDETYLVENKIYPLQLKTVDYVTGLARVGSLVVIVLGLVVAGLTRRRLLVRAA